MPKKQKFLDSKAVDFWLEQYGFSSGEKKYAIEKLLRLSSIITEKRGWAEMLPNKSSGARLVWDFIKIIEEIQKKFVIRSRGQERCEVKASKFMKSNKAEFIANLKTLEMVNAINPKNYYPDAICILGSAKPAMARMISYVSNLMKKGLKAEQMILLSGERYATEKTDKDSEYLLSLAARLNVSDYQDLTETLILKDLYEKSDLPEYCSKLDIIDTPKNSLPRPTTETTLTELIKWLKENHTIKYLIFISHQPDIMYQSSIIEMVLSQYNIDIDFEVIGPEINDAQNIRQSLGGLGSYIWAISPKILSKIQCENLNKKIKKKIYELYYPGAIYNSLPKNLRFHQD